MVSSPLFTYVVIYSFIHSISHILISVWAIIYLFLLWGIIQCYTIFFLLKILFIYLDRGEGKEKERERNINVWLPLMCLQLGTWPVTQAYALTGNRTGNPLVLRPALNPLSYTSQGNATLFYCSNCFSVRFWELFHLAPVPSDTFPIFFFFAFWRPITFF